MSTPISLLFVSLCLGAAACSSTNAVSDAGGGSDAGDASTDGGGSTDSGDPSDGGSSKDASLVTTNLTGTLGTLGAVQPMVSSFVISNGGETLVYMSSAPITCAQLKTSGWLPSTPKGSQVVEIVVKGAAKTGPVAVPTAEVNYAAGGQSSLFEVRASSGSVTFITAEVNGVVEGSVNASYAGGGTLSGTFHAEFCADGQGF